MQRVDMKERGTETQSSQCSLSEVNALESDHSTKSKEDTKPAKIRLLNKHHVTKPLRMHIANKQSYKEIKIRISSQNFGQFPQGASDLVNPGLRATLQ